MKLFGKFLILAVLALGFSTAVSAQKKDSRNVLDYYALLPDNALNNEAMMGIVAVRDIKNGYLKITGAFEGYVEAALFRKKDGSALLLVGATSCGPVCDTVMNAYEFSGDEPTDVTENLLPRPSDEEILGIYNRKKKEGDEDAGEETVPQIYELPRVGRKIRVKADATFAPSGITLYELNFKSDKFVIVK